MSDVADPLLPVGRDCDCGHPLVWHDGQQWCAVYGSHPVLIKSLRTDFGQRLIHAVMEAPNNTRSARRHRHLRHLKAVG